MDPAMRAAWEPLHSLHHAKRPALVFDGSVAGDPSAKHLLRLLGIPAGAPVARSDWHLTIRSRKQLGHVIAGVEAVLSHDGSFPDFSEWREACKSCVREDMRHLQDEEAQL